MRVVALKPGQVDDVLHQVAEPRRLNLHPLGEMPDLISVIARGEDCLGQQRQSADGRFELVADICDKIPPHRINPSLLRQIIDEDEDGTGTQGCNPDPKLEQFAAERGPANPHLLLTGLTVAGDLVDETGDIGNGDEASVHQTKGLAASAGPQNEAIGTHDH
ncbi:unannotated protein [freshwater metagenome]|uniref:Unannotated protein n=1 Tax=freshwater metagenome TaxID=449393 RepID=A0A6J6T1Q3_9ZZZZ